MGKPIEKEFFLVEKKKISSGRILKVSKAAILEDTGLCTDLIEELSISRPITGIEVKTEIYCWPPAETGYIPLSFITNKELWWRMRQLR